jgi:hypothetical protein
MPEAPAEPSPAAKTRVAAVGARAAATARAQSTLPPAEEKVSAARAAVTVPTEERAARAQDALVKELGSRPGPSPEIEKLCEDIRRAIREKRPTDEDKLVKAEPEVMAQAASQEVGKNVQADVGRVGGSYDDMKTAPTPEPPNSPEAMPPTPEATATADINAGAAAPEAIPEQNLSLDADVAANQQQMDDAGMNSEPARLVQNGPIADARKDLGGLAEMAASEVARVRAQQQAAIDSARNDMSGLQESALAALRSSRSSSVEASNSQQKKMVGSEEQQRAQASARAESIFQKAQTQVQDLLKQLSETALKPWQPEVDRLSGEFKGKLSRVEKWIEERHSGVGGKILAVGDWLTGLPDWVTEAYDQAEQAFGDGICKLARDISRNVNQIIATCEAIIAQSRADIARTFSELGGGLTAWAVAEQARFGQRLDGLRDEANKARTQLNKQLAEKLTTTVHDVRVQVQGLRQKARGLVGRIADAVKAFLRDPWRAILEGLLSILGIPSADFWALVAKIKKVIKDIANDPLGFAGKLLKAVGQGFSLFFDHIGKHLLEGLLGWLLSGLGSVGVEVPKDFSLKSVITFFLQIMGITWQRIRALIAKRIGERNMAMIEKAWEIVSTLVKKGPAGIFEMLQDKLNPKEILDQVLTTARDAIIEAVVTRVTARILMLFNPVGAILQAIEAIYRVLKWIINNAARIFRLVETVVNGIADILAGNIGGMAKAVEKALAGLIPPVISFLADYLGFGNLPEKIAGVIKKLQGWVESILDRVIGWLFEQAKRLFAAVKDAAGNIVEWWKKKSPFKADNGEDHTMFVEGQGASAKVMVASKNPRPVTQVAAETDTEQGDEKEKQKKKEAKKDLEGAVTRIHTILTKEKPKPGEQPSEAQVNELKKQEKQFAEDWNKVLLALAKLFGKNEELLVGTAQGRPIYGGLSSGGGYATSMEVRLLRGKLDLGLLAGTTPSDSTKASNPHFVRLCKRLAHKNTCYRAGHLLNHHIGGPGNIWENLTPLYYKANSKHLYDVEVEVKKLVDKGSTVRYVVKAEGKIKEGKVDNPAPGPGASEKTRNHYENLKGVLEEEKFVPAKLVCSYWEIAKPDGKPGDKSEVGKPVDNDPQSYDGNYTRISSEPPEDKKTNAGENETDD